MFLEQRVTGTMQIWAEPFTQLRVPKIFNLRTDPYERADVTSNTYWDWLLDHAYILVPMQAFVFEMIQSMIEFPARQEPASFSIEQVLEKMQAGIASSIPPARHRYRDADWDSGLHNSVDLGPSTSSAPSAQDDIFDVMRRRHRTWWTGPLLADLYDPFW